jgi:hypothetical protein
MNRAALEHLLRDASAVTNERELVVIGSQAILGQFPDAPPALLVSIEADLYPRRAFEIAMDDPAHRVPARSANPSR